MDAVTVIERVKALAARIAAERGLELVNAELASGPRQPILRVFIDKPGGVTHEDCANISLHLGTLLDVEDFMPHAYTLEVSSPGLERELFQLSEYEARVGSLAKIKTREALAGQRNFRGRIAGINGERIIFHDRTRGLTEIPFASIAKGQLEVDWEEELRRAKERPAQS